MGREPPLFMERAIDMEDYDGDDLKKVKEYADRIQEARRLPILKFSHEGAVAETKKPHMSRGGRMLMSGRTGCRYMR